MWSKLKASSLLHVVFVCLLIALLCFGMILLSGYSSLFQKRNVQKIQLQLTNDAAVLSSLSKVEAIQKNPIKSSLFDDSSISVVNIRNWGFYKILTSKTIHAKDTVFKSILIGKKTTDKTALYVTDYDKELNVAGTVKIKGNIIVPKGITKDKNIIGEQTNIKINGITKPSSGKLPTLRKLPESEFLEELEMVDLQTILEKQNYIHPFNKKTQLLKVSNSSFLQNKQLKGNIIIDCKGTFVIKDNMMLEDVIVKANTVTIESGFIGNIQIIAKKSVVLEDDVQLAYPSSILIEKPKDSSKVIIGKNSKLIGGIVLQNTNYKTAAKAKILINEDATVIGAIYCYGSLDLKGKVYGNVYTDRLITKTKETSYSNVLMNTEIDISKLPVNFIGIPLFEESLTKKQAYEIIKSF